jgi:hypothetical protein
MQHTYFVFYYSGAKPSTLNSCKIHITTFDKENAEHEEGILLLKANSFQMKSIFKKYTIFTFTRFGRRLPSLRGNT